MRQTVETELTKTIITFIDIKNIVLILINGRGIEKKSTKQNQINDS